MKLTATSEIFDTILKIRHLIPATSIQSILSRHSIKVETDLIQAILNPASVPEAISNPSPAPDLTEDQQNQIKEKIAGFRKYPHFQQKGEEWLNQRNSYLTASTIAVASDLKGPTAKKDLLLEKISRGKHRTFFGNEATQWGNKYELVATELYEYRNNVKVHEFGLIPSKKVPYLGVSPDGITEHGKMLEIKCPYSRKIDGKIKVDYYHQMQEQMFVCEYEECDFLECSFKEVDESTFWLWSQVLPRREKGAILVYLESEKDSPDYLYSPINIYPSTKLLREWITSTRDKLRSDPDKTLIHEYYWILNHWSCQQVKYNPLWEEEYLPKLKECWELIEKCRQMPYDQAIEYIESLYGNNSIKSEIDDTIQSINECLV